MQDSTAEEPVLLFTPWRLQDATAVCVIKLELGTLGNLVSMHSTPASGMCSTLVQALACVAACPQTVRCHYAYSHAILALLDTELAVTTTHVGWALAVELVGICVKHARASVHAG